MQIQLKNIRVTFPNLFRATAVNEGDVPAFSCSALIEPGSKHETQVREAMEHAAEAKWKAKGPKMLKKLEATDKVCLHDGDLKEEYDGYAGKLYISARSKTKPTVIDRNREPLSEVDGRPYGGCYVNLIVDIYGHHHPKGGNRINAALKGVQFVKDGEPFGAGAPADVDDFDDLGLDDVDDLDDDLDDDDLA